MALIEQRVKKLEAQVQQSQQSEEKFVLVEGYPGMTRSELAEIMRRVGLLGGKFEVKP